jgi:NAD+ kinase
MNLNYNNQKLSNKQNAGFIVKPNFQDIQNLQHILNSFKKHNIKVLFEKTSASYINTKGYDFDSVCEKSDFLVSIGGDGTLISTARRSFRYNKAILGINLGTLGFLTSVTPNLLDDFLDDFLDDKYEIDQRMMIKSELNLKSSLAFNDIVIKGKSISHMVKIDGLVDGQKFNSYFGDGLIISTPTGSTAYNLSSGGPIVYPLTEAFIVTPISPHSLTQRPLVLPANFEISFMAKTPQGAVVIIDGQDIYELNNNETIKIKIASKKAKLIRPKNRDYFKVLNEKLNWGNS